MDTHGEDVLLVGHESPLLETVVPLLRRSGFAVHRSPATSACVELFQATPFQLLVMEHPFSDLDTGEAVAALRAKSSASRTAGLVVVAPDDEFESLAAMLGRGVNRLVRRSDAAELMVAVADLLAVAPRRALRAVVQLEVTLGGRSNRTLVQTVNLSRSGMLIRGTGRHFSVGSTIRFELILPGQPAPIRGIAEVVRHAEWRRERVDGFGVRFQKLESDGAPRLDQYLTQH